MKNTKKNDLLFIEPMAKKKEEYLDDEVTKFFRVIFENRVENRDFTKGWHTCACGKRSDSQTYSVSIGGKKYNTNSLALHYISEHRSEVPQSDLNVIRDAMKVQATEVPKQIKMNKR